MREPDLESDLTYQVPYTTENEKVTTFRPRIRIRLFGPGLSLKFSPLVGAIMLIGKNM